ncbi:MAG: hypothetical protein IJ660_07070 [Alphaproteobacteria bacterium]|nr:hypothetical protein [Alphaproteobacteria bacterium]
MAKYTKRLVRELCVQLRIIRENKNIPIHQVLEDLDMKEQTLEQIEKNFSGGINICYHLMEYYGYQIKLVPMEK